MVSARHPRRAGITSMTRKRLAVDLASPCEMCSSASASRTIPEEAGLREAQTFFSNHEVQAALAWKFCGASSEVFVDSVWPLLDEYRAHLARHGGTL